MFFEDLNSDLEVLTYNFALDSKTAMGVIADYDVVLDCSDNVATRLVTSSQTKTCSVSGRH